jgi:hypothetical protein
MPFRSKQTSESGASTDSSQIFPRLPHLKWGEAHQLTFDKSRSAFLHVGVVACSTVVTGGSFIGIAQGQFAAAH